MIRNRGFTLAELMATLAVAAILIVVAVPSFYNFIKSDTITAQANTLVFMLNIARSEAVKQDVNIYLCPSNTAASPYSAACDASSTPNWAEGILVYCNSAASNAAGVCSPTGTTVNLIRIAPPLPSGFTLKSYLGGAANYSVQYLPTGTTSSASSSIQFTLCDSQKEVNYARDVEILPSGRTEASTIAGQTLGGVALTCP